MTKTKSWYLFLGLILCILCLLPQVSLASSASEQDSSLAISYTDGEQPLAGVTFDLYRVGTLDDGIARFDGVYKQYPVSFDGADGTTWRDAALTLEGYISKDKLPADVSQTTDKGGNAAFADLQCGLYLVSGTVHVQDGLRYVSEPFLVQLPAYDGETWLNKVTVATKFEKTPVPGGDDGEKEPKPVKVNVVKVWKDGGKKDRPTSVKVDLLKDGQVEDTVTLNEDCQWRYTWENLSQDYSWTIVEQPCDGYKVKVSREGDIYLLTNTWDGDDEDFDKDNTKEDDEKKPGDNEGDDEEEDTLPLTGQPWVVVMGLLSIGLLFIVIGLLCKRGAANDR